MNAGTDRAERVARAGLLAGALRIAAVSARPYAGSWNDGSRLATVESLVGAGLFWWPRRVEPAPRVAGALG